MSRAGMRRPTRFVATAAALALAVSLTGCGGDDKKSAEKPGPPPPPPSAQPETQSTAAPGSKAIESTTSLRKPVTYADKISVSISGVRHVTNKAKGPGELTGNTITIFTLKFTNGSGRPLDLNKVQVTARYGAGRTQASPTSYANINDFYGTVAAGGSKSAAYAFSLPSTGYKAVTLSVKFDDKHKTALFAGSLRP